MGAAQQELRSAWKCLSRMQAELEVGRRQCAALGEEEEHRNNNSSYCQMFKDSLAAISNNKSSSTAGLEQDITRGKELLLQVHDWCQSTKNKADQQYAALKQLKREFADTAMQLMQQQPVICDTPEASPSKGDNGVAAAMTASSDELSHNVSKRISCILRELKNQEPCDEAPALNKRKKEDVSPRGRKHDTIKSSPDVAKGKRKLWHPENESFSMPLKTGFVGDLQKSFQRVRQRELACINVKQRLHGARLLLQQAQKGCIGPAQCKRQIDQAYTELLHVQHDIDAIKYQRETEPKTSFEELMRVKSDLWRHTEAITQLKKQVANYRMQAQRAEGLLAKERSELDKLQKQVSVMGGDKRERESVTEAHLASVKLLEEQLEQHKMRDAALQCRLESALRMNEELHLENDALSKQLDGQKMDTVRLRRENLCLVVEKVSLEVSARSLDDRMSGLVSKLSETKQRWRTNQIVARDNVHT